MRKIFLILSLFIFACDEENDSSTIRYDGDTAEGGDCVWVGTYYQSDGDCVRGHWRSSPGKDCSLVGTEYQGC